MSYSENLSIVIWNAQIRPARSNLNSTNWRACKRFIYTLILQQIDFIGIIEIDEKSVEHLNKLFRRYKLPYHIADGTQKRGNTRFDTCIIYRADKFLLDKKDSPYDCRNTDLFIQGKQSKGGQNYTFYDTKNEQYLNFVLVHWPSNLTPNLEKTRHIVARNLREHLDIWLKENINIIIAGDFNTEPFCSSLTDGLRSYREPLATIRSPNNFEYLYNASWSLLHIPPPLINPMDYPILGTYFYNRQNYQHWYTFDQVMFTKNLVHGTTGWQYVKNSLKILGAFDITNKLERWSDHLPIQFSLTWKS